MTNPREEIHRQRIKRLNGAVSISAAAWITEDYVKLHALWDSPIEPVRLEFMRFLGESLDRHFKYGDTDEMSIGNSPIFNGLIWDGPQNKISLSHGSPFLLGSYTSKGNSQIWGLTSKYGEMNTTSIVFPINNTSPECTKRLQQFIAEYRAKFSYGWSEQYGRSVGEGVGDLVTRVKTTP